MDHRLRAHRRRSFDEPGIAHELTFTCYRRYRFLGTDRTCRWLAEAIQRARERLEFDLWAYVFMPEHVHLIVRSRRADGQVSAILKAIKQPVGRRAVAYLQSHTPEWLPRITRARAGRTERLFWQSGGGYDRAIITSRTLEAAVAYIHENPVRRGLVARAVDWTWSSAGWFIDEAPGPLRPDPIPPEWWS